MSREVDAQNPKSDSPPDFYNGNCKYICSLALRTAQLGYATLPDIGLPELGLPTQKKNALLQAEHEIYEELEISELLLILLIRVPPPSA